MKISVDKNSISKALQIISLLTKSGVSLPILSNCLLETREGNIIIKGTDLNSGIVFYLEGEVLREGKVCFSITSILEYVQTLDSGEVLLEEKEGKILIEQNKSRARIPSFDSSEYPDFSPPQIKSLFEVDFNKFNKILKNTTLSVVENEGRAALEGIYFKQEKEKVAIVGTDGYRLSISYEKFEKEWERDILVPAKSLVSLVKNIEDEKIKFGIDNNNNQLYLKTSDREITIRLIAEDFPNFSKIIPTGEQSVIRVSKEDFSLAVNQMAVFAKQNANIIKIELGDNIKLSTQSGYVGSGEAEVEAKIIGEKIVAGFNYRYLKEFLNAVSGEEIKITFNGPLSPVKIESDGEDGFLHIIMPVKL